MGRDPKKIVSCFALVSDFGSDSPYLGQIHAVLANCAPHIPVVNLLSDAPEFNTKASAYLLCALANHLPNHTLFVSVVDPGVGSDRLGLIVETDKQLFIGPDNGLLSRVAHKANKCRVWSIDYDSEKVSPSFHGRDVFSPVAASLANGEELPRKPIAIDSMVGWDWPAVLYECIYVDHYGNIITGISNGHIASDTVITIGSESVSFARTFSDVLPGELFWYVNSCGLVEIAANMARASELLGVKIGEAVSVDTGA